MVVRDWGESLYLWGFPIGEVGGGWVDYNVKGKIEQESVGVEVCGEGMNGMIRIG